MEDNLLVKEWHKKEAVNNFNATWELIDKKDRSKEEQLEMIHKAHASRHHWSYVGTPLNFARGEWQISRVYALCEMGESALYHGQASLDYCIANDLGDFDLAFAYEAMARAYKVVENKALMDEYLTKARQALGQIKDKGDFGYVKREIDTLE